MRGRRIADRYVVEETLGEGGMGVVLRAHDERLDRDVAIKVLSASAVGSSEARARLIREARAAAALEHPGIVHIYDVGATDDGGAFLAMERVRGRSLRDVIASGALTWQARLRVIVEVARALGFAHRAGFVHRDVKPDNIMVRDDGRAVVLDFGIAKHVALAQTGERRDDRPGAGRRDVTTAKITIAGTVVGTPAYLAPEQAQARAVAAPADQFALAVTAFEALTGALPWSGSTTAEILEEVVTADVPVASALPASIPAAVGEAIARAMSKGASARFPTIDAFADALERALATIAGGALQFAPTIALHAPTDAATTRVAPIESKGARRSRRRFAIALAVGAAAVAATVATIVRLHASGPAPSQGAATRPSDLAAPASVLACVPLRARGVPEPSGWLGAAAASIACGRAQLVLGGSSARTLVPAELLDLPRTPSQSFPRDPYGDPPARDRAVAAARARAAAYLDGDIEKSGAEMRVRLVLRAADGRDLAAGDGKGRVVYDAVRAAMAPLLAAGAIPRARDAEPSLTEWARVRTIDAALAMADLNVAFMTEDPIATRDECKTALVRGDLLPDLMFVVRHECAERQKEPVPHQDPPPFDRSSAGALVASVDAWQGLATAAEQKSRDAELEASLAREPSAYGRAMIASALSERLMGAGDTARANELAMASVQADPKLADLRHSGWHMLAFSAPNALAGPAHAAWVPWEPIAQVNARGEGLDEELRAIRRAAVLVPRGYWPRRLGELLLKTGDRDEARAVAVEADDDALRLQITMSEARFAAALKQGAEMLARMPPTMAGGERAFILALSMATAAAILGRPADFVDDLVARYLDVEPPRIGPRVVPVLAALRACMAAPARVAERCTARLSVLYRRGDFGGLFGGAEAVLDGASRYAQGDFAGAARAWRPLLAAGGYVVEVLRDPIATALDRAKDGDLADKLDARALATRGAFNGVDLAWTRAAARAKKRGDDARAKELARAVVDAWATADEAIPALAEMKRILATR